MKNTKLAALVTGVAVFLVGVSNAILPATEGKNELSFTQKTAHRYHIINSNVDVTLNSILGSVFASVTDNNSYTYSGVLKQSEKHWFVKAMLTETTVHKKRKNWSIMKRKTYHLDQKQYYRHGHSRESVQQMDNSAIMELDLVPMVECRAGELIIERCTHHL